MPRRLVTAALAVVVAALPGQPPAAQINDLADAVASCRRRADDAQRLRCYDALPVGQRQMDIKGTGSHLTPAFDLTAPAVLHFESMDAILVVYLLDEAGQVVQNLHQAGVGASEYAITRPGRYRVQLNASGGWRLWLEDG